MRRQRQNLLGHLPLMPGRPRPPATAATPTHPPRALPESAPHPQGSLTPAQEKAGEAAGAEAEVLVPTLPSPVFDASHHGPHNNYFPRML